MFSYSLSFSSSCSMYSMYCFSLSSASWSCPLTAEYIRVAAPSPTAAYLAPLPSAPPSLLSFPPLLTASISLLSFADFPASSRIVPAVFISPLNGSVNLATLASSKASMPLTDLKASSVFVSFGNSGLNLNLGSSGSLNSGSLPFSSGLNFGISGTLNLGLKCGSSGFLRNLP